jgi:hypothetical protein
MAKQFTLRFPLFVWTAGQDCILQVWEALSDGITDARDLRVIVYKVVHPDDQALDRVTLFTMRDVRGGVAEYWPKTTSVKFPLLANMKGWGFKLVNESRTLGTAPLGHSYCGVCGEECQTVRGASGIVGAEFVSHCCWGSLWADPSLTVEWEPVEVGNGNHA